MSESVWLSAHLFYAEPWEDFLIRAVHPFVNDVIDSGTAEQFFFIRYWERGPHIRLRFKGRKEKLQGKLRPELETYFSNYFSVYPSKRLEPAWVSALPDNQKWIPNNSVQFIDYEPEIERYGGPEGILISERQFEYSSRCVLEMIRETGQWEYSRALGAAIQLHIAFSHAMNMRLNEAIAFYERLSNGLLPFLIGSEADSAAVKLKTETILTSFDKRFADHRDVLVPYCQTLWQGLEDNAEFDEVTLNDWIWNMSLIHSRLLEARRENCLIIPAWFSVSPAIDVPQERHRLWFLYSSYVHMTNNRLGILNQDEAYVAYLISRCLKEFSAEHALETK